MAACPVPSSDAASDLKSVSGPHSPGTVLVTGGGGFIGSHLVPLLLERGDNVVIIDDFSTGQRSNLTATEASRAAMNDGRLRLVEGRVSDCLDQLDAQTFSEIYHLAAAVGVRLVVERPIETVHNNVLETTAILQFAAQNETPFFLASTSEIYGKSTQIPFAEDDDVVYGPTTKSRWSYACSKAIDEFLALAWHRERALPVVVGRFFNTVGPRQVGSWGMVLPRFVNAALQGQPLIVHGDGLQTRCFCDVRDVVRILPKLMRSNAATGLVVNIGSDERISILDLARRVIAVTGSSSTIELMPYDDAFGAGFDDLRDRVPDLTRLRSATDFVPRYGLDDTIQDLAALLQAMMGTTTDAGRTEFRPGVNQGSDA